MFFFATLLALLYQSSIVETRLLNIRIGSPVINTSRVPEIWGLAWHGALIDIGIRHVQHLYADTFNITQKYLLEPRRNNEVLLYDDVQYLMAQYFYENEKTADAVAFISGASRSIEQSVHMSKFCAIEQAFPVSSRRSQYSKKRQNELCMVLSPAANWRVDFEWEITWFPVVALRTFHATGLGNGPSHAVNPQYISLSVYSEIALYSCICTFMERFNWTSISSIVDETSIHTMGMLSAMHEGFTNRFGKAGTRSENLVYLPHYYDRGQPIAELHRLFKALSRVSRIVFIYSSPERFRKIMIEAYRANMTNGDYVFFYAILQKDGLPIALSRNYTWRTGDVDDKAAFEAYKSVIILSSIVNFPEEPLPNFRAQVLEIARTKYNFNYPQNMIPSNVYPSFEAILLYFMVLNETLHAGENISDGNVVAARMIKRTFNLPTGQFYIDATGEKIIDITLETVDQRTGEIERAYYYQPYNLSLTTVRDPRFYWPGGLWPPPNEPICGFLGNRCSDSSDQRTLLIAVISALALTGAILAAAIGGWMRWRLVGSRWWLIHLEEIIETQQEASATLRTQSHLSLNRTLHGKSIVNRRVVRLARGDVLWSTPVPGWLRGQRIKVTMQFLKLLRDVGNFNHDNINRYRGLCDEKLPALIFEAYCVRGSLAELVGEMESPEVDLKVSMLTDLLAGVLYIHKSSVKFHGYLRNTKCVLDSRLGLKVSDTGKERIVSLAMGRSQLVKQASKAGSSNGNTTTVSSKKLLWTAPEILRGYAVDERSDVYSFGILAHGILLHKRAFGWPHEPDETEALGVVDKVRSAFNPPFRPAFDPTPSPPDVISELASVVKHCWEEMPEDRVTLHRANIQINQILSARKIRIGGTFFEKVMSRLNAYSETLEMNVEKRTQQLMVERRKCENLLLEMFPRDVLRRLQGGKDVQPENFDSVTVCFSSIVGFLDFVRKSSPEEALKFLDTVFNDFDKGVSEFDVYKVETIGDIYMVASGLPIRNGSRHVVEVCRMALRFRELFQLFASKMPMELRIGMHSGQVVAGVVGSKSPRYCLFGDAVNTASRMESHGLPGKIHLSPWTASGCKAHGFVIESRGEMEVKGKGKIETYFLTSDNFNVF